MYALKTPAPIPPPINTVVRARSAAEAAWMLVESQPGTKVIAGGTDLMLHIDRRKVAPSGLIDIRRAQMNTLSMSDTAIHIGATATATDLSGFAELQTHAAGLWEAAATLSVPTIRNFATLGGNVANASPAADMVPPVLAMDGFLEVRRGDDTRRLLARDLATGPGRTCLEQGDLITNVVIPRWHKDAFHHFAKLGFRDAQVIAVVSLALSIEMEGDVVRRVGIALGSVAPKVTRAPTVEEFLIGKKLTREVGEEAMRLLAEDIKPIDDVRSEAAFRLKVAQNYLGDALGRAYIHSLGDDARGLSEKSNLKALKDPAPRPPSLALARTDVLGAVHSKPTKLRIVAASASAFAERSNVSENKGGSAMATRKKKRTTKKKKTTKRKAKKKTTKKKAKKKAKKKTTKKKAKKKAKKKTTKRKAKKKTAKKKAKKKTAKRKTKKKAKKKAAKRKTKRKATKKKAKKKTTKRKTKRKTTKRKTTKRKAAKKKSTKRKTKKRG